LGEGEIIIAKLSKNMQYLVIGLVVIAVIVSATLIIVLRPLQRPEIIDDAPVIASPTNAYPYANTPIQVSVAVTDDFGVDTVLLSYSIDAITWQNLSMTGTGTTAWLGSGAIPEQNIEETIYYQIFANDTRNQWSVNDNNESYYECYTGSRKALIINSANDFTSDETEDAFNASPDATFDLNDINDINWTWMSSLGSVPDYYTFGPNRYALGIWMENSMYYHNVNWTYDWITNGYILNNYAKYTMNMSLMVQFGSLTGPGVRIGFQWINADSQIIRTDWSESINNPTGGFIPINVSGYCNNASGNEISKMNLIVDAEGWGSQDNIFVYFDNVTISWSLQTNLTDPTDFGPPPPPYIDSDGFPAQALQEYWILKDKGYSDENIFFMLYHTNDPVIDIYANDGIPNDLVGAIIDVENNDVNASRLKKELNGSISGSFVSSIQPNDQLIVSLIDHGSNALLGDGNATFHFEADNSLITEFEFFDIMETINCSRMLITIDSCFSGNFIQNAPGVFYTLSNAVMVSASANVFAWYWINNQNGDGFAGSWFFNQFWQQLSMDVTIMTAFQFGQNFIPFGQAQPLIVSQMPQIADPNNWANSWSFASTPRL
jgi:hypothetical protein